MDSPRVFTIPASAPFVPTLIRALIDGKLVPGFPAGRDPLALAGATLYLPTRRACRLARDLFLDEIGGNAAILPRIVAIGDVDEDEIAFAQAATGALAADALDLPPALGGLARRLLLAQLVLKWASSPEMRTAEGVPLVANSPSAALALADDLARLMDDMTTRQVSWDRLDELVPAEFDEYWQLTLRFLKIARDEWPKLRDERGEIEPAARRDRLIAAEAKRLAAHTDGPVIAAGSTGSMPATAELIATIARLPHGAVVLPGLDIDLDPPSWELIGGRRDAADRELVAPAVGHPQFAMRGLLRRIGIARDGVITLGEAAPHEPGRSALGRERFVSEALRPAAATDRWQQLAGVRFLRTSRSRAREHVGHRGREYRRRSPRDCNGAARSARDPSKNRSPRHARPRVGASRARRARALEDRGRRLRRRCARRYVRRTFRAPGSGSRPRRTCAGAIARPAQAPAHAARCRRRRPCTRHRSAGKGRAARPASAAGHHRSHPRARDIPCGARKAPARGTVRSASVGAAGPPHRRGARRSRHPRRKGRGGARAARSSYRLTAVRHAGRTASRRHRGLEHERNRRGRGLYRRRRRQAPRSLR